MITCSACLIYKAEKSAHITPLLFNLHWLPISSQIQYKTVITCFHIVSSTALPYLSELLHLYSPSPLHSASDTQIFHVPRMFRRTLGGKILSVYWTCHLELSSFLCQACHIFLLFQVKIGNPPLLFCLLIYHFLSSVSIKPMTTMLVFLQCVCVCVHTCVCGLSLIHI